MKNARIIAMSAALAAEVLSNSNDPNAILKAWETTLELLAEVKEYKPYGTVEEVSSILDADESVAIALKSWTKNPETPAEVIEAFWRVQNIRRILSEVWQETIVEILALPKTPEEIADEIYNILDEEDMKQDQPIYIVRVMNATMNKMN